MRPHTLRQIAFWAAIILVGTLGILVFVSTQRLIHTVRTADRTQIVLYNVEQMLSVLRDAETGQRGYLLSGEEHYLEAYNAAAILLPGHIAHLRTLTSDLENQQRRLDRIEALATQRLELLRRGVDSFRNSARPEIDRTALASGTLTMDQIRNVVDEMIEAEGERHRALRQDAEAQALRANMIFIFGIVASLLIICLLFFLKRREIRRREQAETALQQLNRDLERHVAERTGELQAEAEERRRRSEELQAVFDEAAQAIIGLDPDGQVMLWNRSAERILGYKAEEVVGGHYPVVPDEGRAEFDQILIRTAAGERVKGLAVRRRRKDGKLVDILLSGAPLYAGDGSLRGYVFMQEDVTEKRMMQRQLVQAQKMEAIGQLSGGIAHDFNNLLAIAIGNLDLLQLQLQEGDTASAQELVDGALKANLRGAELTKQLLAFSRKQDLAPQPVDINALVTNMTALLRRTLGETIDVSLKKASDLWLAEADPTQVESALTNLAINARDAMPNGGRLTIETRNVYLDEQYAETNPEVRPGDYAMLAVSDTGTGIAAEDVDRVFDPFFTTKPEGKGTGLGLSMIYGFAKQSGGHVKIYSEIGHGTTVRLYLPRTHAAAAVVENNPLLSMKPESEAVLVVEDNPAVRAVAIKQLRSLGYQILEAGSMSAALEVLRSDQPVDLLFSDVVMPGGTGVDLAVLAKELRPRLKVLLTSGFTEEALRSGASARDLPLLSKPYQRHELARKIAEALAEEAPEEEARPLRRLSRP